MLQIERDKTSPVSIPSIIEYVKSYKEYVKYFKGYYFGLYAKLAFRVLVLGDVIEPENVSTVFKEMVSASSTPTIAQFQQVMSEQLDQVSYEYHIVGITVILTNLNCVQLDLQ